jgi:hypothetical protein
MLERTGIEWLLVMFETYFDDSGTDAGSPIAVAAAYVSTRRGWKEFVDGWDKVRREERFEAFHMAEFVAPPEQGHKPFCDWDGTKKERVYRRLAKIINENKRIGLACAVPKVSYDQVVPDWIKANYGKEHYTFAVRMLLNLIITWREKSKIILPMQYIFDWEMSRAAKRKEISAIWDTMHDFWAEKLGTERCGYAFQHKEDFKPLQSADILAWQMRSHMERILPRGYDTLEDAHWGFRLLREYQEMDLGFFTEDQLKKFVKKTERYESAAG